MKKKPIYKNKWCKVINSDGYYILKSKSGKYNDQYYRSLKEVSTHTGIPVHELRGGKYHKIH